MKAAAFAFTAALSATQALAVPMSAWEAQKDGIPWTYEIGGLSLTLSSVKGDDNAFPVLTIHAKGAPPFAMRGDDGGFPAATFGVGRFDPKGGDQQVVFTYFTGGAHCCDAVLLAEHAPAGWRTIDLGKWDGGFAVPPVDIDDDGGVDFVFVDQRFLYAFGCFACGHAPPQIMSVVDDKGERRLDGAGPAPDLRARHCGGERGLRAGRECGLCRMRRGTLRGSGASMRLGLSCSRITTARTTGTIRALHGEHRRLSMHGP